MEKISIYTLSGTIYEIDEAVKFVVSPMSKKFF